MKSSAHVGFILLLAIVTSFTTVNLGFYQSVKSAIHQQQLAAKKRLVERNLAAKQSALKELRRLEVLAHAKVREDRLVNKVLAKYDVEENLVREAVKHAVKYERAVFPRAEDLVAVIGIESSWNPNAKSSLATDPAIGLTQIRPAVWQHKIGDPKKLEKVENQIKYSALILEEYHVRLKDKRKTVIAYNAGITAFYEERYDDKYINKFQRELKHIKKI